MSRIEMIEAALAAVLLSIDGTDQGTYIYNTKTGQVQIYDEALAGELNSYAGGSLQDVNHVIEETADTGVELSVESLGQDAQECHVTYVVTSTLHNNGDELSSKNAMRALQSKLFDDLVFAFAADYTLNNTVNHIYFQNMFREFSDDGGRIEGKLVTYWRVQFSQAFSNPSQKACGY
jgi:hypothetical protein